MFRSILTDQFKRIFALEKVTFSAPGESQEQECLFVDIQRSRNRIKDGRALARVTGSLTIFGNADKLPFGYFSKCISKASSDQPADVAGLFFFDFEENSLVTQNIVQRSCSFTFFFNSQYDPEVGSITSITLEEPL